MEVVQYTQTDPFIVVPADVYDDASCENSPTLNDLITNAKEWVRYNKIL